MTLKRLRYQFCSNSYKHSLTHKRTLWFFGGFQGSAKSSILKPLQWQEASYSFTSWSWYSVQQCCLCRCDSDWVKWFWFLFMEGGRTVLTWLPLGWNFMDLLWSLFSPFTLCIRGLSILLSLISPPPFSALFVLSQTSKCKGDCDVDVFLCSHLWSLVLSRSSKYALIRINLFKHVWPNGRLSFAFWKVKLVNSYTSGHHLSGRQATN